MTGQKSVTSCRSVFWHEGEWVGVEVLGMREGFGPRRHDGGEGHEARRSPGWHRPAPWSSCFVGSWSLRAFVILIPHGEPVAVDVNLGTAAEIGTEEGLLGVGKRAILVVPPISF
jgi:hypothetical protein